MKICRHCAEAFDDSAKVCPHDGAELRAVRDPLIGRLIGGRFRLVQRVGSGGMSTVYLARHVFAEREMAVKLLRHELHGDENQRDRFLREARAVNRISHPNVVEIVDYGETPAGQHYLIMEYVNGASIDAYLRLGPTTPSQALSVVRQAASALARAHALGIVHRDLKPENMLVVHAPEAKEVNMLKLLDFGIAKIEGAPSLTASHQIFGTPGYIAPEYIRTAEVDGRADLYSLGCVLYELLCGKLLFDYQFPGDLMVKHATEDPIPLLERNPDLDPRLAAFVHRCLEKDPENRFADAHAMTRALDALVETLELPAPERLETVRGSGEYENSARSTADQETGELDRVELARAVVGKPLLPPQRPTLGEEPRDTFVDELRPVLAEAVAPEAVVALESEPAEEPSEDEHGDQSFRVQHWRNRLHEVAQSGEHPELLARGEEACDRLEEALSPARTRQNALEAIALRLKEDARETGELLDSVGRELSLLLERAEEAEGEERFTVDEEAAQLEVKLVRLRTKMDDQAVDAEDEKLQHTAALEALMTRVRAQVDALQRVFAEMQGAGKPV